MQFSWVCTEWHKGAKMCRGLRFGDSGRCFWYLGQRVQHHNGASGIWICLLYQTRCDVASQVACYLPVPGPCRLSFQSLSLPLNTLTNKQTNKNGWSHVTAAAQSSNMMVSSPVDMLKLIMQAFCRPPYSTVKWLASRRTRLG